MIRLEIVEKLPDVCQRIQQGDKLTEGDRKALLDIAELALSKFSYD